MEDYILRRQEMTVRMTPELLYDFTLYHTYSRFTGFLSIVLAFAVAIIGLIRVFTGTAPASMMAFYGAAAFLFIAYTPLTLKLRAKKQVQEIDRYREEVHYVFDPAPAKRKQLSPRERKLLRKQKRGKPQMTTA